MNYFFVLEYANYPERPDILFCGNTPGKERKSMDGTRFIVRCDGLTLEYIDWMHEEDRTPMSDAEIKEELKKPEWNENIDY
jgi:hypothetical protein